MIRIFSFLRTVFTVGAVALSFAGAQAVLAANPSAAPAVDSGI